MRATVKHHAPWVLAWGLFCLIGGLLLARGELSRQREAFETDARIAPRLLSQRVVQHDAVLATLALLGGADAQNRPEQRLPSVYPHILSVQRRDRDIPWLEARLDAAQAQSRTLRRAVLTGLDLKRGHYQLLLAAQPASFLLLIDIHGMVPWSEWPMAADTSPVRVTLDHGAQSFVLQAGRELSAGGWP